MRAKRTTGSASALLVACVVLGATLAQSDAADAGSALRCSGKRATIIGTETADVLKGTSHADVFVARGGSDRIFGRGGADVICGGGGSDKLFGHGGDDILDGGKGSTRVFKARAAARSAPAKVPRTPSP